MYGLYDKVFAERAGLQIEIAMENENRLQWSNIETSRRGGGRGALYTLYV